jgi:FAD synthetase
MSLKKLVDKYIDSAEHVFREMQINEAEANIDDDAVRKVVESAKAYLDDAKYYRDEKRFEVSLASVAYCEGLLDALRMLGAVKFEWSTEKKEKSRK